MRVETVAAWTKRMRLKTEGRQLPLFPGFLLMTREEAEELFRRRIMADIDRARARQTKQQGGEE